MHHALNLEEILYNIFGHCAPPDSIPVHWLASRRHYTADLAALARTCCKFKEPALNVLWSELVDVSPLARCLFKACYSSVGRYSFRRPLSDAEWNTLRGYTRRVWFLRGFSSQLGMLYRTTLETIFKPPFADPLFPNLRSLYWRDVVQFPVVHLAVPSLTSFTLDVRGPMGVHLTGEFLNAAAELCPGIKRLRICVGLPHPLEQTMSRHVCRWMHLEMVGCPHIALSADALVHLASMPTLKSLSFTLRAAVAGEVSGLGCMLVFSSLAYVVMSSESLASVVGLLSRVRLPVVKGLVVKVSSNPLKHDVDAYMTAVGGACPAHALFFFELLDNSHARAQTPDRLAHLQLGLGVLHPCTAFTRLRAIHVNLAWPVSLTDADLLALVSAAPHLKHLVINDDWGWRNPGGITLDGFLELLRTCPSLYDLCLALDTPTFTRAPRSTNADTWLPLRPRLSLNVVDSRICAADVPKLAWVFTEVGLDPSIFAAWHGADVGSLPGAADGQRLWEEVFHQIKLAFLEMALTSETP